MGEFIGLLQRLTVTALFVVCTLAGSPVLAIAPVLDLNADDTNTIGFGHQTGIFCCMNVTSGIAGDVLITDSDSNKISRAVITILNPKPGDFLIQNDLKGQLSYDPSSTDTQLIVTGNGLLEKYEAALESIEFSYGGCPPDCDVSDRYISVVVEDIDGESSNTAITIIRNGNGALRDPGYIYATIRNALNSVTLSGAVVGVSESYEQLVVDEAAGLYILRLEPSGVYTVNASLPGYEPTSVNDVVAEAYNDPSSPIQINLDPSDADADVVPDGQLNAGDFLVATRIVLELKTATTEELIHGDMNGDGQFTLSDLILIMQAIQIAP